MIGERHSVSAVAAAAIAAGVPAAVAGSSGSANWQTALNVRSEALNARYGLGDGIRANWACDGISVSSLAGQPGLVAVLLDQVAPGVPGVPLCCRRRPDG